MWRVKESGLSREFMRATVILAALFSMRPTTGTAQQIGNNAVFNSSGICTTSACGASAAFIDANPYANSQSLDICTAIYNIINSVPPNPTYPAAGAVIDARGISGQKLTCPSNTSPWLKGGVPLSLPSTILLPAGIIVIPVPWTLPPNTRVIGQGGNPSSGTVIQACTGTSCSSSFLGSAMIQFGSSNCLTSGKYGNLR